MRTIDKVKRSVVKIWNKRETVYTFVILCGAIMTAVLMYVRAFYGTELTDEAYYVAEAKEMLNGNIPFAYAFFTKATGFPFILIAIEAVYKLFVPDLTGVFLFSRLCFVAYKVLVCFVVYRVLQRRTKRYHALLLSAMMLPIYGYLQNFSYNTIPQLMMLMAGCLLYDVIEQGAPYKKTKTIISGFITAVGCFANPGWGVALVVFVALILFRVSDKKEKARMLALFLGAVLSEVFMVVVPIVIQTSFSKLWYGFYRLFINPIPVEPLNPDKTWAGVVDSFIEPVKMWIKIFIPVVLILFAFSRRYISENGEKLSKRQCLTLSITGGMFVHLMNLLHTDCGNTSLVYWWAFVVFCYMLIYMVTKHYKEEKIIWYLGIYPVIFAVAEIMLVSHDAGIWRFENVYTVTIPVFYVLIKHKVELIRIASSILVILLIISYGYLDFHYVYRDENFHDLNYKVQAGVYKGLYTTEARAEDLPKLEEYLNDVIDEGDTYAFRDNVPGAYLMTQKGTICDISTWDALQYSYHRNSPAKLFDYYRIRDMIPTKIIYIDFGRNENLWTIKLSRMYF